jgi:hypothetical protein
LRRGVSFNYLIEAHAKDISNDTYTLIIIALDWLNIKVDSFLTKERFVIL